MAVHSSAGNVMLTGRSFRFLSTSAGTFSLGSMILSRPDGGGIAGSLAAATIGPSHRAKAVGGLQVGGPRLKVTTGTSEPNRSDARTWRLDAATACRSNPARPGRGSRGTGDQLISGGSR